MQSYHLDISEVEQANPCQKESYELFFEEVDI